MNTILLVTSIGPFMVIMLALLALVIVLVVTGLKVVPQANAIVVERLGRFHRVGTSGINVVLPLIEKIRRVTVDGDRSVTIDVRERVMDFKPQSVITADNANISIDSVVFYQIIDPARAAYEIQDVTQAISQLATTTLRNIVGELSLDETLVSRETVNKRLRVVLDEATDRWGVKVNRVELKQIAPPDDLEEAMAKQMKAERARRAQVTAAEGAKEAAILRAQGERDASIAEAEGRKRAAILAAEGQAESIRAVQQAEADAIRFVDEALAKGRSLKEFVSLRYLDALGRIADGKATKLVLPYEATSLLGAVAGLKEVLGDAQAVGGERRRNGDLRTQPPARVDLKRNGNGASSQA